MHTASPAGQCKPPLTIFTAKRIHTMDESRPTATAVAVSEGRIVAVGDLANMGAWQHGRTVTIDTQFENKVLLPGLIDNHIHPFLGAVLLPTEHIAPEPWRQSDGSVRPAATTPDQYRALLLERVAAHSDTHDYFITFGYQPSVHGRYRRAELDALFPERPVVLLHRSFHESFFNTAALVKLGLDEKTTGTHPQINWADGHFFETGHFLALYKLLPHFLRPQWYGHGLGMLTQLMHMGGITTAADMMFGAINPEYEIKALKQALEANDAPVRVVNVFDARSFADRAVGRPTQAPDAPINFAAGLNAIEPYLGQDTAKVWFSKAAKLFADGAMFSQLMQMNAPGYTDGHTGEWLMAPPVLAAGVQTFWHAGWQIHVHVNGDGGMDAVLAALEAAQAQKPRFDHRFFMHHVGFHTNAQSARMAALGAHASVNPYYIHALADDYAALGLGEERSSQITRCGSLTRAGLRVSFHSDFMLAPAEPLFLAWCAATRTTASGQVVAPEERLDLMQALRGVTIDAAWALKLDHDIGSIVAGKRADFCVLEDDPFELGVAHLKDVRIAGTVFEGKPYWLKTPVASIHALSNHQSGGLAASSLNTSPRASPSVPRHVVQAPASGSSKIAGESLFAAALRSSTRAAKRHAQSRPVRYRSIAKNCRDPACGNCDSARRWANLAGAVLAQ